MGRNRVFVTIENQTQRRTTSLVVDRTMWVLLIATMSSCITMATARSYSFRQQQQLKQCYQCHAGPEAPINDNCRHFDNKSEQPTTLPCTHNCYIRYDTSGAVSRGCFHTTFATEDGEVRCQSISSSVYCFCDTHRCNSKSLYELAPSLTFQSDLTFPETSRSNEPTPKVSLDIIHSTVAPQPPPSSTKTTSTSMKRTKDPLKVVARTKLYKRRHDHGLSHKQSKFPYSFQSMFRNSYIY